MGGGSQPRAATPAPAPAPPPKEKDPRVGRVDAKKRRASTILTGDDAGQAMTSILGG
jgi:hypothetical protein